MADGRFGASALVHDASRGLDHPSDRLVCSGLANLNPTNTHE
jgi:hypothetical protein